MSNVFFIHHDIDALTEENKICAGEVEEFFQPKQDVFILFEGRNLSDEKIGYCAFKSDLRVNPDSPFVDSKHARNISQEKIPEEYLRVVCLSKEICQGDSKRFVLAYSHELRHAQQGTGKANFKPMKDPDYKKAFDFLRAHAPDISGAGTSDSEICNVWEFDAHAASFDYFQKKFDFPELEKTVNSYVDHLQKLTQTSSTDPKSIANGLLRTLSLHKIWTANSALSPC